MSLDAYSGSFDLAPDFSDFVAINRGISAGEAQQLIENWLKNYSPQARPPIQVLSVDNLTSRRAQASI